MSGYDNLLAGKDQTIKVLWFASLFSASVAVFNGVGWYTAPSNLRIHIPPNLESGAVVRPDALTKANVYSFAFYIWQQLYRWQVNGEKDYTDKIHMLVNYLTPECYQNRLDDYASRRRNRELDGRERSVWEIPGREYHFERVHTVKTNGAWVVSLDLHIRETLLGEKIKERYVNYPIRVVRYAIDPQRNAFGLAIDCLADSPRVIEPELAN